MPTQVIALVGDNSDDELLSANRLFGIAQPLHSLTELRATGQVLGAALARVEVPV